MRRTARALGALALVTHALAAQRTLPGVRWDSAAPTQLIVLGSGAPLPDPARHGPAFAVTIGTRVLLFDAGADVMRRIAAAGLPIDGVTDAFLTHLHSDHTLGLPDLILTSWVMGRRRPLPIVGPPGTRAMTDHLLAAWAEDIRHRTEGLEHGQRDGQRVRVNETRGGTVYHSAGVTVRAVPVHHASWPIAFAYHVTTPDRTIVLGGDFAPTPALEAAITGVDLFVAEVYPSSRALPEPRPGGEQWPAYLRDAHTSDAELGAMLARAKPKQVVLTHILRMGGSIDEIVATIRQAGYTGIITVAEDGARIR
ncbi:MAG: MBL fold metallo-hydrolase [Gemmatimonadaceae bacterium]|nr:MBL fold metallo-hydrolase [Gemmatimonadaceae bacterium]